LVLIGGLFVDNMNNEPLRSPIQALDETVQFAINTQGQAVDKETSRKMHLAAIRDFQDWLDRPRYYYVGGYDDYLGQVTVMANFGNDLLQCTVVYNQTSFCKSVSP